MTTDIVMYGDAGRALFIPVGEDQVAHVELSREIVRRFNTAFGLHINRAEINSEKEVQALLNLVPKLPPSLSQGWDAVSLYRTIIRNHAAEVGIDNFLEQAGPYARFFTNEKILIEPDAILTRTPRIPGLDGRKMSKSYGNAIELGESDESIRVKTKAMITDPARKRRTDPGNPDICPVYDWHKLFSPAETLSWASVGCKTAGIGCIECKSAMADNLITWITPIRARRQELAANPAKVLELIDAGSKRARATAQETMSRVREAVFGWNAKRESVASAAQVADTKQKGAGD
jgi:tryptophanyl-tRNA synthetase